MAWKIDRDYLESGDISAVGTRQGEIEPGAETFRFRLKDDDGRVYYGGVADRAAAEDDEDYGGLYQANAWGEAYAGAIWLEVKAGEAATFGLYSRELSAADGLGAEDWVGIYA
jgi:hypothetical protein